MVQTGVETSARLLTCLNSKVKNWTKHGNLMFCPNLIHGNLIMTDSHNNCLLNQFSSPLRCSLPSGSAPEMTDLVLAPNRRQSCDLPLQAATLRQNPSATVTAPDISPTYGMFP